MFGTASQTRSWRSGIAACQKQEHTHTESYHLDEGVHAAKKPDGNNLSHTARLVTGVNIHVQSAHSLATIHSK